MSAWEMAANPLEACCCYSITGGGADRPKVFYLYLVLYPDASVPLLCGVEHEVLPLRMDMDEVNKSGKSDYDTGNHV